MRGDFNLILVVSALCLTSVQASPTTNVRRRGCRTASDPACDFLLQRCVTNPGFWGSNDCVAAATCSSVATVFEAVSCASPADPKSQPSLDYNLYAGIVGDCAWATGGCPITPQNYVEFYNRTLSNAGSPVFPDVNTVNGWWNVISLWANTGLSVPYMNFNDWLHYSSSPAEVVAPVVTPPVEVVTPPIEVVTPPIEVVTPPVVVIPPPVEVVTPPVEVVTPPVEVVTPPVEVIPPPVEVVAPPPETLTPTPTPAPAPTDCNYDDETDAVLKRTIDISNENAGTLSNLTRRQIHHYVIDCKVYPNVCENQCYYVYCKGGHWSITVERRPALRGASECGGYNRCSHGRACGPPRGGWPVHPEADWSCDEQPKSSTREGGLGSATRCMPRGENSGEGASWGQFINGKTTGAVYLPDGYPLTVLLENVNSDGYCASYSGVGNTACGTPAVPPGDDDPRQR